MVTKRGSTRKNTRLRARPAVPNTGAEAHPAIKTAFPYQRPDTARAERVTPTRGDAGVDGVRLAQGAAPMRLSPCKKGVPVTKDYMLMADAARRQAVQDFRLGVRTIEQIAADHGVKPRTVDDWIRAFTGRTPRTYKKQHTGISDDAKSSGPVNLGEGAGGKMSDGAVRHATKALELKITAMQRKLNMPTFDYRR